MTPLTPAEVRRYARHLVLPEVGRAGQARLSASRVLCVGAGGLGSPLLLYLAAAGVGTLGVVDDDVVDVSNLQRQVLYGQGDVGRPKAERAAARLSELNPLVAVEPLSERLTERNALELVSRYDVVADGSDNFATRYLVNDACVLAGKPDVHASVYRFEGLASVLATRGGACYRCLYPDPPEPGSVPSCVEGGVLGVLPGLLGAVQAAETLKLLLGLGEPLVDRLLVVDALAMSFRTIRVRRDAACAVCGDSPTIRSPEAGALACGVPGGAGTITVEALAARLGEPAGLLLLDVRDPWETAAGTLPGALAVPLRELSGRIGELPREREVVVVCEAGRRSERAAALLRAEGFARVSSLEGGLARWRERVDPLLPVPY